MSFTWSSSSALRLFLFVAAAAAAALRFWQLLFVAVHCDRHILRRTAADSSPPPPFPIPSLSHHYMDRLMLCTSFGLSLVDPVALSFFATHSLVRKVSQ